MVAARYDCILVTSVDPNNPMFAARRISLWFAVTFDADHGEIHLADDTIRVLERQWKVSINAVPDIASLSLHAHPWRDGHQNRRLTSAASVRLDPPNHIPAVHNNTNAVRHGTRRKQMEGAGEPVILRQAVVS